MSWCITSRSDRQALLLADRHYNRQSIGSLNLAPPGKSLVLYQDNALWVSIEQKNEFIKHCWKDSWICSTFRNESKNLSSDLINLAVSNTLSCWGSPPSNGFITFVNPHKIKSKNPGYCFLKAGWEKVGVTKERKLIVLQLKQAKFPCAVDPIGKQYNLFE